MAEAMARGGHGEISFMSQTQYSLGAGSGDDHDLTNPPPDFKGVPGHRMPREGPVLGGGTIRVADRARVEQLRYVETPTAEAPLGLTGDLSRRSSSNQFPKSPAGKSSQRGGYAASVGRSSSVGKGSKTAGFERPGTSGGTSVSYTATPEDRKPGDRLPMNPEERRQAKLQSKFDKAELQRDRDRKAVAERIHQRQEVREERFKRLLDEVTGEDNLAYTVGLEIRQRDVHQENRRRELHSAWESKVYQPLAAQAFDRINRAELQRASGAKSVDFHLPSEHPGSFRLVASVVEDPARKSTIDNVRENAFHQTASAVLNRSCSAPELRRQQQQQQLQKSDVSGRLVPAARARSVLEPTSWGAVEIGGTLSGLVARVSGGGGHEHAEVPRCRKGGKDAHLPTEADGVTPAGTRRHRDGTVNHKGVLCGEVASQGISRLSKSSLGAGSGAPAQDHYTFETGAKVVDMEFLAGKRMFPGRR